MSHFLMLGCAAEVRKRHFCTLSDSPSELASLRCKTLLRSLRQWQQVKSTPRGPVHIGYVSSDPASPDHLVKPT
jgi:hypothetical protein